MLKTKVVTPCFAVLLFFGYSLAARAQDTGAQQPTAQAQSGMHQHASRLDWLSKELSLTDDQKDKLKPILADETKQMHAVKADTSLTDEQKHDKMKQIHETTDSQINGILTPDQQKKFAELKEQHKAHQEGTKPQPY